MIWKCVVLKSIFEQRKNQKPYNKIKLMFSCISYVSQIPLI